MEQETLQVSPRDGGGSRPSRRLRREGRVPAVVYGRDVATTPIEISRRDLFAVLNTDAGLNALINVEIAGGDTVLTVAREIQRDPVRGDITHLDFIKVSLDVEIEAEVALNFVGVPLGVKDDGGIVETLEAVVPIRALPTQIPTAIEADVSDLGIGDTLKVSDLPAIEGVAYLFDEEQPLLVVSLPAAEVEEVVEEELLLDEEGEPIVPTDEEGEGAAPTEEAGEGSEG
jgi:large subunit ribosomal protein L25